MLRLLVFTSFLFLIFAFSNPYRASAQTEDSGYSCKMDNECLNYFHNVLLDKESNEGIYQYCQINYENIKSCCLNPLECQESYGKDLAQELRNDNLNTVQISGGNVLSCELNRLSALTSSLSDIQSEVCNVGVEKCKSKCENKLSEFKQSFRECFFVPDSLSIDEILEKAKAPPSGQEECYQEMKELAEKYKEQSLNKHSELREELKVSDVIQCEEIKTAKTQQSLNDFALSMCYQAQIQEQETFNIENKKTAESKSQDKGKKPSSFPLGAGALAGSAVGAKALQDQKSKPLFKQMTFTPESFLSEEIDPEEQVSKDKLNTDLLPASLMGQTAKASDEKTKTSEEGFFTKTMGGVKSIFKKGINFLKNILPFVDSEQEIVAKVKQLCLENRPLIQLKQTVYQSVKAPQAERLDKESDRYKSEGEKNSPFDNYDLIQNKPAGVIVRVKKSLRSANKFQSFDFDVEKLLKKIDFSLSLKINGEEYNPLLCSRNLPERLVNYKPDPNDFPKETVIEPENSKCVFEWSDFRDEKAYKFFPLPMNTQTALGNELGEIKLKVSAKWKPKNSITDKFIDSCEVSEDWTVNVLQAKSFKILFTGMHGPDCGNKDAKGKPKSEFDTTEEIDIINYLKSKEISDFYDMFPVAERGVNKPEIRRLLDKKGRYAFPIGSCDKGLKGMSVDAIALKELNLKHGGDRIVAVFKENYKTKHHQPYFDKYGDSVGLAFSSLPTRYFPLFDFLGGDIHFGYEYGTGVVIVQAEQQENGVFLHEIAHTLGQWKEYYTLKINLNPNTTALNSLL